MKTEVKSVGRLADIPSGRAYGETGVYMRLIIHSLIALMLVAVLGGILWHQRHQQQNIRQVEAVQHAMRAIESQSLYRTAVGDAQGSATGYALQIDPEWFDRLPRNLLVREAGTIAPWLDLPQTEQGSRFNPNVIVADAEHAEFWYCPVQGIVRARVPQRLSQGATVDLYNMINGTSLRIDDVQWTPQPKTLDLADAKTAAPQIETDPVLRGFSRSGR